MSDEGREARVHTLIGRLDGEVGEMSLCPHCMNKMTEQMGANFAAFRAIERDGKDKGVRQ